MLLEFDNNQKEESEKKEVESSTELEGMLKPIVVGMDLLVEANIQIFKQATVCCACSISGDVEVQLEGRVVSRKTLPPVSVGPPSPLVRKRKKKDLTEVMEEEAKKLLSYFNHRCVESLLRLTRSNLEMLRKRIEQPSINPFSGAACITMLLFLLFDLIEFNFKAGCHHVRFVLNEFLSLFKISTKKKVFFN